MNKRNVIKLANRIKKLSKKNFSTKYIFLIDDGDPVDIAGHARKLNGDWVPFRDENGDAPADIDSWISQHKKSGREYLEISEDQADRLFAPRGTDISPKDAAKVLFHLAETDEVDWSVCK